MVPDTRHLIVHHTVCSKWVILRSCPTQKSRPITFCPYMMVIPSRRKREVGLGVMLPKRSHWHRLSCQHRWMKQVPCPCLLLLFPGHHRAPHNQTCQGEDWTQICLYCHGCSCHWQHIHCYHWTVILTLPVQFADPGALALENS